MINPYIHGGMREWALALCRSNEPAFDTFLEKSGPVFAQLFTPSHTRGLPTAATETAETGAVAAAICAQLGLKPDALKA